MTPVGAWGVVSGLTLGMGLWLLVSCAPRLNRPRLLFRVAPYVVDVSAGARNLLARRPVNPLPVLGTMLGPGVERMRHLLGAVLGGSELLRVRLRQAGESISGDDFRSRQLTWGVAGLALGALAAVAVFQLNRVPLPALAAGVLLSGIAGVLLRDYALQRAAKARLERMTSELPTVLEFLTLSLSAGEGILDGIRRIARISSGELASELAATVAAVSTGIPFSTVLVSLAQDLDLPPLTRAVDQIVGALERGTPLVEVLRAQSQDARDIAKRDLLEVAGKKEVAMLVPLVFLILPMTILFAVYPGIFVLQSGF